MSAEWELVVNENEYIYTDRLKVDGGHLYRINYEQDGKICMSMSFVPDVDLTKYQSHLRDAYNQGYKDGLGETIVEPNGTAYNRGFKDGSEERNVENV